MADILKSAAGNPLKAFLEIEWTGDVAAKLISASFRMQNFDTLLRTIGRKLVGSMQRNFFEQRSPGGQAWRPLKRPRRKGHNPGSLALLDTLHLYDSINYDVVAKNEVDVGFPQATFYGKFQNDGTRTIPQREFLGARPGDLPDLQAFMGDHAREAFAA